jgi:hypothetical protein
MKWFWCIIAVLAVAAVGISLRKGAPETPTTSAATPLSTAGVPSRADPTQAAPPPPATQAGSGADIPAPATEPSLISAATALATSPISEQASTIARLDNRSVLLDGRFTVHGRGDEMDPYVVPWDLLISAGEIYIPDQGKSDIPKRVAMLDGAQVTLNGFLAAPLAADETSELLVMFNKWDGCCIGTPPSPFDAVEVKLTRPVQLTGKHMIRYGAVTGRLHVEPFLIGDMLVSLYRMDDASISWDQQ